MRIGIRNFQVRPIIEAEALRRLVETTLDATGSTADAVSFVFVDDTKMTESHDRFLGIASPTDVLAFPATLDDPGGERDLATS